MSANTDEWFKDIHRTIIVDIDGTVTKAFDQGNFTSWAEYFANLEPDPAAVEAVRRMKEKGYKIIFMTSRHDNERQVTEDWLKKHGFEYDELVCMKPPGIIYIDDRGMKHVDWETTNAQLKEMGVLS